MTRIAIMGTRGVPSSYGGFETFAEELGKKLVESGYEVDVWARNYIGKPKNELNTYQGMNIKYSCSYPHKYLDTPLAALTSFLKLIWDKPDLVLLCNAANSPFAWIIKLLRIPLIINVDGIERKRAKWGLVGKLGYRVGEVCSVLFANKIIADAKFIGDYYKEYYKVDAEIITYGANVKLTPPGEILNKFKLKQNGYILYVSRLEPENNALGVIESYVKLKLDIPLVIVGDAPYADEYKEKLKQAANENVIFTGYQFHQAYYELRTNCYFCIQGNSVGGIHPSLVEAMAYGNAIIANGAPQNIEVLGDTGLVFQLNDFEDLSEKIMIFINNPELIQKYGNLAKERAYLNNSWKSIADKYIKIFEQFI